MSIFSIITPLNYLIFLASSLLLFLGYLCLPRGFRAQYCGAARRRYRRKEQRQKVLPQHNANNKPTPKSMKQQQQQQPEDILDNIYAYSHSFSPQEDLIGKHNTPISTSNIKSEIMSSQASAFGDSVWSGLEESECSSETSASNQKQQLHISPQQMKILLRQPPGIKCIAHGTKCRPRPVWITLHHYNSNSQDNITIKKMVSSITTPPEYQDCLTWRAELKLGKMGNLRKVEMMEVLGIELGKRTTALRRVQTAKGVNDTDCFSLLTRTGTLDLECTSLNIGEGSNKQQTSAEEVRAAFITCLAVSMASKGLQLNGLQPLVSTTTPRSLHSKLQNLNDGVSPMSQQSSQFLDEQTMFTGLMSNGGRTISTVSF